MSEVAWRVDVSGNTQSSGPTVSGGTASFLFTRNGIFAGIVGVVTLDITVAAQWTPFAATPSPYLGFNVSSATGAIEVLLEKTDGDYGYGQSGLGYYSFIGACEGILTLTVTADGVDCSNTLIMSFTNPSGDPLGNPNNYSQTALGYGVGAPTNRWTNIRQAVEV